MQIPTRRRSCSIHFPPLLRKLRNLARFENAEIGKSTANIDPDSYRDMLRSRPEYTYGRLIFGFVRKFKKTPFAICGRLHVGPDFHFEGELAKFLMPSDALIHAGFNAIRKRSRGANLNG